MDFGLLLIVCGGGVIGWHMKKLLLLVITMVMVGCAGAPHLVIGTVGFMNRYIVADHQRMREEAVRKDETGQKETKRGAGFKE